MEVCDKLHAPAFSPRSPMFGSRFDPYGEEGIKLRVLEGPACRYSLCTDSTVPTPTSFMVGGKFVRFDAEPGLAAISHSPEIRLH